MGRYVVPGWAVLGGIDASVLGHAIPGCRDTRQVTDREVQRLLPKRGIP